MARSAFVELASQRARLKNGRTNHSRIAARTGLPRTAVKRAFGRDAHSHSKTRARIGVRAVLAAWHVDPKYLASSRKPSPLPLTGRLRSFERLCRTHSPDIPYRAILSELLELAVVSVSNGIVSIQADGIRKLRRRYLALRSAAATVEKALACAASNQTKRALDHRFIFRWPGTSLQTRELSRKVADEVLSYASKLRLQNRDAIVVRVSVSKSGAIKTKP